MRVLLVRHGAAVDLRSAPTDELRWLTRDGRAQMLAVAQTLRTAGLSPTEIYTSPLVRAVQTAEILAAAEPRFEGPIEIHPALASEYGTTAQALAPLDRVDRSNEDALLVLVTHMPKIEVLAGHLCGTDRFEFFQPGACCLIEVTEARGAAQWMLDPKTCELRRS